MKRFLLLLTLLLAPLALAQDSQIPSFLSEALLDARLTPVACPEGLPEFLHCGFTDLPFSLFMQSVATHVSESAGVVVSVAGDGSISFRYGDDRWFVWGVDNFMYIVRDDL